MIFDIEADPKAARTKPFADITEHNHPKYRQVLFAIGSIFRIIRIEQSNDQLLIARMSLCNDDDPDVRFCFNNMKKKYEYYNDEAAFFSFCRVLREMKKFEYLEPVV